MTRARTVQVPVRMLEHSRFRLRRPRGATGRRPGQRPSPATCLRSRAEPGPGREGRGRQRRTARFSCCSSSRSTTSSTGCGRRCSCPTSRRASDPRTRPTGRARAGTGAARARGSTAAARSRKRSNAARNPGATPTFTDDDLRFRQLARRKQPAVHAVVFFMLDVSGSMGERDRKLAKTFFFWVVQGLRREYRSLETVFVAHTTEAWEFNEAGVLPGDRHRRHGDLDRAAQGARDHRRSATTPAAATSICSTPPTARTSVSDAAEARAALASIAADTCYTGYVEVSLGPFAAARHRDRQALGRVAGAGGCHRQLCARRLRRRVGRGASLLLGGDGGSGRRMRRA